MGIAAVKNLVEEGFDVTGFEKSSYYGGLWHFTEDKETLSILECWSTLQLRKPLMLTFQN